MSRWGWLNTINVLAGYDMTKWNTIWDMDARQAFLQLVYLEDKAEADRQRAAKARLQK